MDDDNDLQPTNAGDEWPSYDVPTEVATAEPPAAAQPPTDPAPPATPPVAPAANADGTPQAQPNTPTGGAPGAADGEVIPKYRLDETVAERDRYRQQVEAQGQQLAALTAIVQRLTGEAPADPNAPPAPAPLSPEDQRVRDRLLQVVPELALLTGPELKELLDRKGDLMGVVGETNRWRQNEQAITEQFVDSSIGSVFDAVAAHTLGEGKKGSDLNKLVQDSVLSAFSKWVSSDPSRVARFERHDQAIAGEFWTAYKAAVYDPIRRDGSAALLQRAANPPALPQGGSQPAPAPAAPKPPNALDEDAVHAAAWGLRDEVGQR